MSESELQMDTAITRSTKKFDSLQAYRAIAAILVVLYHMSVYSRHKFSHTYLGDLLSFGYAGVDFFFVLSGFIIVYVHTKDIGRPEKLRSYLLKRFIRVYPFYWVLTLGKLGAYFLAPSLGQGYEGDLDTIIKSLLLFPQDHLPIIGAAWSLSNEVWFYLLFGLAIVFGLRVALWVFGAWFASVAGFYIWSLIAGEVPSIHYLLAFVLNSRNLEFFLGCLSAYLVRRFDIKYPILILIAGALLFLCSGLSVVPLGDGSPGNNSFLTFGIPSLLIVTASATIELRRSVRVPKWLVFLGDASYSIYLTHFVFMTLFTLIFLRLHIDSLIGPFLTVSIIILLEILGGSLVHYVLERPFVAFVRNQLLRADRFSQIPQTLQEGKV